MGIELDKMWIRVMKLAHRKNLYRRYYFIGMAVFGAKLSGWHMDDVLWLCYFFLHQTEREYKPYKKVVVNRIAVN